MKTKIFALFTICFFAINTYGQSNLNNYKYVIVPAKYNFLKDKDQYQLNSLTAFLFNKYGFLAVVEGTNYPEELLKNRCLALKSDLIKESSMLKTKLAVQLIDCNDIVVYTSQMGESREKEFQRAYNEALRNAFKSIQALNYKYKPSTNISIAGSQDVQVKSEVSKEIETLRQEIENLKKEKETTVVKVEHKAEAVAKVHPKEALIEEFTGKTRLITEKLPSAVLYAQAFENGFQLVDNTPKVIYKIKKTSIPDVYLVEAKNAILYKKDGIWVLEHYENDVLKQEVLNIKF